VLASDVGNATMAEILAPLTVGNSKCQLTYLWLRNNGALAKPLVVMALKQVKDPIELAELVEGMLNHVLDELADGHTFTAQVRVDIDGIPASNRGSTECSKTLENRDEDA